MSKEQRVKIDDLLFELRPAWRYFFWNFVFFWLIIPLIVAVVRRNALWMRVYEDRISLEAGILSKRFTEIFIKDIRTIDVRQSLTHRVFSVGDVLIGTAGTAGYELLMYGLPNPRAVKDRIIELRQKYM